MGDCKDTLLHCCITVRQTRLFSPTGSQNLDLLALHFAKLSDNRPYLWLVFTLICPTWIDSFLIHSRAALCFFATRSYAALRAADLDWIVGPGYSLGQVHSGERPWKTNLEPWKTMTNQPGPMTNQPGTMKNHGNQPGTMRNHEITLKNHGNQQKTMKNHETALKNHVNQPKTMINH